jgi:hypothetical protein
MKENMLMRKNHLKVKRKKRGMKIMENNTNKKRKNGVYSSSSFNINGNSLTPISAPYGKFVSSEHLYLDNDRHFYLF